MPATAGRVRMPHDNRVSVSKSLATSGIWAKTIRHDPYAGAGEEQQKNGGQHEANEEEIRRAKDLVKRQNVQDGVSRDAESNEFALKLFKGLKGSKKRRMGDLNDSELDQLKEEERQKMMQLLSEETSSSEDEAEAELGEAANDRIQRHKHHEKKDNKRSKKKHKRRRRDFTSSSDDDSSDEGGGSDDDEDSRDYRRRKDKRKRKDKKESSKMKEKKHRKNKKHSRRSIDYESSSSSDEDSRDDSEDHRKRRRKREKKHHKKEKEGNYITVTNEEGPEFIAAPVFEGSRNGYVFKLGDQGIGYYIDRPLKT